LTSEFCNLISAIMNAFLELSWVARSFLLVVLVVVPALGVVGYLRIRSGKPLRPKRQRYRIIIVVQFIILLITLWAARREGIELLGRQWGAPEIWLITAGYAGLIVWRGRHSWARMSADRLQKARRLLPDDPSLMRLWVGISAMAGISEECAYRGLAYQLLARMSLNPALAVLVCVVCFAIGHMIQGWRGVLGTFLLALIFHGLVFLTQSLYLAIAFHATFNLIVGMIAMPVLSRFAKAHPVSQVAEA
jgi:membrane protease YdiL (CAAX protease family)